METRPLQFIPHVTISPNYLVFWDMFTGERNYHREGLVNNDHEGEMSMKASKRVRTIITWFTELTKDKSHRQDGKLIKYRLTFATLTLPSAQKFDSGHDDEFIKRNLLNRFLQEAKRKWNVVNYLWRAEAQENGNIHFHITFDKFIYHVELRNLWNGILSDNGYIKTYQEKMREFFKNGFRMSDNPKDSRSEEQQRQAYVKAVESNFSSPNSTDIHSIYKIRNVGAYLAKYVSKNLKVYTIRTAEQYWKVKKEVSKHESFLSMEKTADGYKAKFSGVNIVTLETFLSKTKLVIDSITENVIRAITGRLWFCSRSLKQLKNITLELTTEVFSGINEMLNATPHEEKTPMQKNKYTGEQEPNRYVKVFIGDFLKIAQTKFIPETESSESGLVIDFIGSWYDEHIRPLLQSITREIKSFFSVGHEELITI